jgi:hypothetical protein
MPADEGIDGQGFEDSKKERSSLIKSSCSNAAHATYGASPSLVMHFTYLSDANLMRSVHFLSAAMRCALSGWPPAGGVACVSGCAMACDAKTAAENPKMRATSLFVFMLRLLSPKAND